MLEKPGGFRGNLPLTRIGQCPPRIHVASNLVDGRSRIVLLLLARKPFAFVEYDFLLRAGLVLLRLRNWRDKFGAAPFLDNLLRGLA